MRFLHFFRKCLVGRNDVRTLGDTVFIGLGNPGVRYSGTRHNIGSRVVHAFAAQFSEKKKIRDPDALIFKGVVYGSFSVAVVQPTTYMNRSGCAVESVIKKWHVDIDRCLIVVDDFHLPFGTVRFRQNGSDGGHKGLKSIIEYVGPGFPRLRVGIGPLPEGCNVIDFVLGEFSDTEEMKMAEVIRYCHEAMKKFAAQSSRAVIQ